MADPPRWSIIAWAPYSRRSEAFARDLGGRMHHIHYLRFHSPPYAPFKYVLQTLRTFQVLFRDQSRTLLVENPPIFLGLVSYLYCLLAGAQYVIDHHSGAFARVWRWARPLHKFLAKRAATNVVTSEHWAEIVSSWGARTFVLADFIPDLPQGKAFGVKPGFNVVVVSTYAVDEPLEAVAAAAALLPEVNFYITGDSRLAAKSLLGRLPPNVVCTGFIPEDEYLGLLRAADAIMALTTQDHTLQCGGIEAVALGKPLITSTWPYLKKAFSEGAIFVLNTSDGIRQGIIRMQREHHLLEGKIRTLRQRKRQAWEVGVAQLLEIVADAGQMRKSR